MGPIVLLTDFGDRDGYVGVMKGVIATLSPTAQVIDLSHHIPAGDVDTAKFVLWNQHRFFPKGSIFVGVVDPGVGSSRSIIAVKTADHLFIVPDNGMMDYILSETKAHTILRVENPAFFRTLQPSNTFHGRDIFAAAAGHLAAGEIYTQLGPFHSYQIPPSPFLDATPEEIGSILYIDHFGNLITNFRHGEFQPQRATIQNMTIPVGQSYSDVNSGELVCIPASHGLWEISLRDGSAAERLHVGVQTRVSLK